MSKTIENGLIKSTMLGMEDHGIFTYMLHIEFAGSGCGYGGYALDEWNQQAKRRVGWVQGIQVLADLMAAVGVRKWEDLPGTYVRCEHEGWGGKILKVGHVIEDKWFCMNDYTEKEGGE